MSLLTDLTVPGPTITAVSAPFWQAAEEGRLVLQLCANCDRYVFYPRRICPFCWEDRLEWFEASGLGTLKSYSRIFKPGHPGWAPAAPYTVGLVTLNEGPCMLSLILGADDDILCGAPVRLMPTKVGDRTIPAFTTKHDWNGGLDARLGRQRME